VSAPTDEELRTAAVRLHYDEGNTEIDPDAKVSRVDDDGIDPAACEHGAYVQAWVWVPYDSITDEDRKNAHPDRCDCKTCRPELYV